MVEYFTIPELGADKPLFRCEKRSASITVAACSKDWAEANSRNSPARERLHRCVACPLGAEHSGAGEISLSPLYASDICARCNRQGHRMVGQHLCVSCWNREREFLLGRNARGAEPKLHPPLYRIQVLARVGERVKTLRRERCVDTDEVIIATLRDESKRVLFSFSPIAKVSWVQQELPL